MTTDERNEERYKPGTLRQYEAEGIIVHWEAKLCIHVANCMRELPRVFDPKARPWVNATGATADEIAKAVEACPTGALRYERTDGATGMGPGRGRGVRSQVRQRQPHSAATLSRYDKRADERN